MSRLAQKNRTIWYALAVLFGVCLFLGFRTQTVVTSVLWNGNSTGEQQIVVENGDLLDRLSAKDSLLSVDVELTRDPFKVPSRPKSRPRTSDVKLKSKNEVVKPVLRALLFDNVNPSVQLSVGSTQSSWLRVGDTFQGWFIQDITSSGITVVKDEEEVFLQSP
ncbi:MAG: hypothetical protein KJ970_17095 [Candidatus Eisenbacteria bacterium]|uniref:Uncharacterized protein n=1 Tax=Eiseniibacteriota bacterium TaxID=2212470 RepID=A0A948W7I5_UNCEI|nr:hypothetical protein [Candidatus Eisenbacteria bacterium]MBU1950629.1 hypothetical protein [Candidatus Eisenbacteria bacterium]MBU2692634.1 hypothetical protein [Candidatus Eisenbacteria bacterium]